MGTEHYEINAYEAAIRLADALGAEDVGGLLRASLEQEVKALENLGKEADRLARSTWPGGVSRSVPPVAVSAARLPS